MCSVCKASFPRRDRAYPRRNVLCLHSIVSTTRPRSPAQKRTVFAQHRFHDETALTRAETYCVCTASFPRRDCAHPRRNVLCLHSIVSTTRPRLPAQKRTVSAASSQPTRPRSPAQKRTVSAQHLLNRRNRTRLRRAYCVCTASSQPTRPRRPRRNVLCSQHRLDDEIAFTRTLRTAFARVCTASFRPTTALDRAETSCVCTYLDGIFVDRRDPGSAAQSVLCLHSILSTTRPRSPAQ